MPFELVRHHVRCLDVPLWPVTFGQIDKRRALGAANVHPQAQLGFYLGVHPAQDYACVAALSSFIRFVSGSDNIPPAWPVPLRRRATEGRMFTNDHEWKSIVPGR